MRLTVDTRTDSKVEIRHAIEILTSIVQRMDGPSAGEADMSGLMSMFDAPRAGSSAERPKIELY